MKVQKTNINCVKIITPKVFGDNRGFFMETWNEKTFAENGLSLKFVQDNHSKSVKNSLRGLHYQLGKPQGKLVRVTQGEVYDVAVDLRKSSPTFGKWVGEILTADNKKMMWLPEGFGHGFLVLSDTAEFQYKCTDFYDPISERCIIWNDPTLNIQWPLSEDAEPILSNKDKSGELFAEADVYE